MKSSQHSGGPQQSHQMEAQVEVAQPCMCVGRIQRLKGWGRGLDRKEEKMHEQTGHEKFR